MTPSRELLTIIFPLKCPALPCLMRMGHLNRSITIITRELRAPWLPAVCKISARWDISGLTLISEHSIQHLWLSTHQSWQAGRRLMRKQCAARETTASPLISKPKETVASQVSVSPKLRYLGRSGLMCTCNMDWTTVAKSKTLWKRGRWIYPCINWYSHRGQLCYPQFQAEEIRQTTPSSLAQAPLSTLGLPQAIDHDLGSNPRL